MAVIGKRVIHPGGKASTEVLLARAQITASDRVLDVGCGVATTTIEIARRHRAQVTAADISPLMLERAEANAHAAGVAGLVTVTSADILALPFDDAAFDVVIAEAVTMFTDRPKAAAELARVTRPGGRVLATEFYWREPPTPQARAVFLGQVCPGLQFDTVEDWTRIYSAAGLTGLDTQTGPFEMMTPRASWPTRAWPAAWRSWAPWRDDPPTPARWPGSCRAWPRPSPISATSSSPAPNPHERAAQATTDSRGLRRSRS
jgi:SAM-dependent methyltransferase